MLNVPEAIDSIAYNTNTDGTGLGGDIRKKSIRVRFVGYSHRDLTNSDIVQESFSFTESICSADVLKFGLSEAAEVTFETVGIENITGRQIEIFFEIDVSDLDSEHHCAGRYISDTDNCNREIGVGAYEVTRGVYSIPIGVFTVIEAERSKSDMTHRSIRAITTVFETNDDMTPYEIWKLGQMHRTKYFYMVLPQYVDCQVYKIGTDNNYVINGNIGEFTLGNTAKDACYKGKIEFDEYGLSSGRYVDTEIARGTLEISSGTYLNTSICVTLTCSYTSESTAYDTIDKDPIHYEMYPYEYSPVIKNDEAEPKKNRVYGVDTYYNYDYSDYSSPYIDESTYKPEKAVNKFRQYLYDFLYAYKNYQGNNIYRYLAEGLLSSENPNIIQNNIEDFFYHKVASFGVKYSKNSSTKRGGYFSIKDNSFMCLYDKGLNDKNEDGTITVRGRFIIPTLITIYVRTYSSETAKTPTTEQKILTIPILGKYRFNELQGGSESFEFPFINRIYERTGLGIPSEIKLRFKHTLENTDNKTFKYNFENAFTMREILNGYLEINAKFGHQKRNGKYDYLGLPNETTRRIEQHEYEKLYYDEYDISDIRWVMYKYRNKDDKEVLMVYDLKNKGSSIYDMSDNAIFAALDEDEKITDKALITQINNILSTYFKPNLHVIHYWPTEFTMHAKPYLEAGDRYEVVNGNKTFVTYNLNLTMNGIQVPTEEITSTSGQIITGGDVGIDMDEDDDT